MRKAMILLSCIASIIACTKQKAEQVSSIDNTLQVKVDSILQNRLSEINEVLSGITIELIAKIEQLYQFAD